MELSQQQGQCVQRITSLLKGACPQPLVRIDGFAGTGKPGTLNSVIQTPSGPVRMGDICVDDEIFSPSGKITHVVALDPQGVQPTYRVHFRDGFHTDCGLGHLWTVGSLSHGKRLWRTLELSEIIDSGLTNAAGMRFRIPLTVPVQYATKTIGIDPYLLGYAIGDGYFGVHGSCVTLTIADHEFDELFTYLSDSLQESDDLRGGNKSPGCSHWRLYGPSANALRNLGFISDLRSGNMFIPRDALHGDVNQRWALLRGLMDAEGSSGGNRARFSTTSSRLADDVCALVQSLGGVAIKKSAIRKRTGNVEYSVNVKTFGNPFLLSSKAKLWSLSWKNPPSRCIKSIERVEDQSQQCIQVAATDGLYMADHYIVTHNSTILPFILDDLGYDPKMVAFVGPTGKSAKVMRTKLRDQQYPNCNATTVHAAIYRAKPAPVARLEADVAAHKEQLAHLIEEARQDHYINNPDNPEGEERPDLNLNNNAKVTQQRKLIQRLEHELEHAYDNDELAFQINPDSVVTDAQLIVVDEFSMVGKRMANDLLSFGVPILAMGDPGQLPPVKDEDFLALGEPDFFLSEIHRQAEGNPIIHLSRLAREGEDLPYGDYGDGVIVMDRQQYNYDGTFEHRPQFICGKNDTRWRVTQMLRTDFGFVDGPRSGIGPRATEPVLVKKNTKEYSNLVNGTDCIALSDFDLVVGQATGLFSFSDDEDAQFKEKTVFQGRFEEHFSRKTGQFTAPKFQTYRAQKRSIVMDWNYVCTAHSAQGSQYDHVVVIDESHVFRAEANRHLYTSITRAAKTLVVLR